jgi:hypothetical protein
MFRLRGAQLAAGAMFTLLLAAGCGSGGGGGYGSGSSSSSSSSSSSTASGGAGASNMTLEITSPKDGATVDVPFPVDLSSSVELGPTSSGKHHVHVYFDSDSQNYLVVEGTSVEITDLAAGKHVIHASLRNADHSAAGVETEVTVTVATGGMGSSPSPTGSTGMGSSPSPTKSSGMGSSPSPTKSSGMGSSPSPTGSKSGY